MSMLDELHRLLSARRREVMAAGFCAAEELRSWGVPLSSAVLIRADYDLYYLPSDVVACIREQHGG